ncbi:hypothetical protein HK104_009880 [Borealophlyctis nickersoniae]|nr:hypothetical protein HK104_009880 [Borealophlyctis nickersoniae]
MPPNRPNRPSQDTTPSSLDSPLLIDSDLEAAFADSNTTTQPQHPVPLRSIHHQQPPRSANAANIAPIATTIGTTPAKAENPYPPPHSFSQAPRSPYTPTTNPLSTYRDVDLDDDDDLDDDLDTYSSSRHSSGPYSKLQHWKSSLAGRAKDVSSLSAIVSLLTPTTESGGVKQTGGSARPRRLAPEELPEQQFLTLLLRRCDSAGAGAGDEVGGGAEAMDELYELVKRRVDYLNEHDDAAQLQRMPFWKIAIWRCPAILATLTFELGVGGIISAQHVTLEKHILLASFMPILSSMSGNIGLQASTTTLRALATGHASSATRDGILKVVIKELASASVIGMASFVVLAGISGAWAGSLMFGIVTGFSILASSVTGGIIGSLSPIFFKALGVDPALTAGPFETAVQDMIGISIYLGLAAAFL